MTRDVNFQHLSSPNSLWWKGPAWVTLPDKWPKCQPQTNVHMLAAAAIAEEFVSQATIKEDNGLHYIIKVTDYSSLNHIKTFVYKVSNESFQVSLRILPHMFRLFTVFP